MDSILELLHKLQSEQVEFVLIGGLAATLHGSSVVTQDLDICFPFDRDNNCKLISVLKDLDPRFRMSPNRIPIPLDPKEWERFKNLYLETNAGQLDILSEVDGLGNYDNVKNHSQIVTVNGLPLRILSIPAIIQSKSVLKREKDRLAILELTRLQSMTVS